MTLSIAHRQYLAFFTLTIVILATLLGLSLWSFQAGFLRFIQEQESARLESIRDDLLQLYAQNGNAWSGIEPFRLDRLLGPNNLEPRSRSGPPREGRKRKGPGPKKLRRGPGQRSHFPTALFAVDGGQIAGAPGLDDLSATVNLDLQYEGTLVGQLRTLPKTKLLTPEERRFQSQQTNTMWMIGAGSLVLAALFAFVLSRRLLDPIGKLVDAIGQLSRGDYSARLGETPGDELGGLMQDLNRLATKLDQGQSARRRWLADVSHELRTPVTALTGEIEALKDGVRSFDASRLEALDAQTRRIRLLIDDLYQLSVSDIGGFRYQFHDVSFTDTVQSALDLVEPDAMEHGLVLERSVDPAIHVDADQERLGQLLQNLLANAVRYTDAPGTIHVRLTVGFPNAVLELEDTPPGPSAEECAQLFEPLYRREASRDRESGGAGLGLAICQNIVAAHGGTIAAYPSAEGGLLVRVLIPLQRASS